jgi:nitrite reductase/ring-hydroxylating ferredoxin subunit/uncharacterized membrane protein
MLGLDRVHWLVHRIGSFEPLDKVARPFARTVARLVQPRPVKDVLSGTWLGHPLHPLLTDVTIGAWTSAVVLDLFGGKRGQPAAQRLVGLGVVSALPTAAAGLSDWSDTIGEERRIGLVHASSNVTAVACYTLSYLQRRRGQHMQGLGLSLLGTAAATAGAYLGGHLVYRLGIWVDHNAFKQGTADWRPVLDDVELVEGRPVVVQVRDEDVLLVKRYGQVYAIADTCGHAGGPLHQGDFSQEGHVTCPWHYSTFCLSDGHVVHGPATGPQPAYDVRVDGGKISLRRR